MLLDDATASLDRYAEHGVRTGDFLRACLKNNLTEALFLADPSSLECLLQIVRHIHWILPAACHGSAENVRAWINMHAAKRAEREAVTAEGS